MVLVAFGGVVALGLEDRDERLVGREVGAVLADRFELAVELRRPVAPPVAQHGVVVLVGELGHAGGAVPIGSEPVGFGVEGIDLVGDGVVGVGNGLVGDPGINQVRFPPFAGHVVYAAWLTVC